MSYCDTCKYELLSYDEYPCSECARSRSGYTRFEPKRTPEQPTIPPMPPVTPQQEEINHPSRYAGGKYECIDVMLDVFGIEATKNFCLLNAFKYIWRQEHKNGVEDIKKADWYLNKFIELSGGEK